MFRADREETQPLEFDRLVRPHITHLYQVAYRLLGTVEDAEDLVQDVLVKLYPLTGEMAGLEKPRAWITKVLYRQFVDNWRKKARRPDHVQRGDSNFEIDDLENIASPDAGPEQLLEQGNTSTQMLAALGELGHDRRALIVLHLVEGYTLGFYRQK